MENIHNKSATIRALGTQLSRRICTGQVIVSLAGACRELIDNAVDAGATNIEIRATDNGLECLEVIDNGTGISPSNFEHLCKAHSTSKLFELDDFRSLTTFGFRGEALNALAALGDVQITTRDANARCATRLTFDRNGESLAIEQCSRPQGTTVRVANLFAPLPVRRAEFQRQARREFLRLVDCVQACAIARPWCRFTCTNSVNGGKRMTVLCTPGGSSTHLPQVLDSLFGTGGSATDGKGKNGGPLLSLLDETVGVPSDECLQLYGVQTATTTMEQREKIFAEIRLSGFVSSCLTGQGRSSADRQFVFVNQRHVDFPKLCRIAKEVYTQFNRGRFCCLVLFVGVPPHTLDVNISPDKRTVFLHYEKEVFAKLRATLFATFAKCQGNFPAAAGENNVGSPDAKKRRTIGKLLRLGDTLDAENGNVQNHCGRSITFPAETQQSVDLSCMTFATAGLLDEVEQHTMNNEDELLFDQHTQQNQDESVLDDWTNDTSIGTKMSRKTEKRATKTVKVTAGQKALEAFSFQRLRSAGPSPVVSADQHIERPQTTTTIVSANPQKSNTDKMRLFDQMPLKEEPPNSQKSRYDYGESSVGHHHHCQFEFVASPTAVAGDERCASPSSSPSQSALPASQCSSSVVTSSTTMSVLTQQTQQYHGQQQQHDDDHHYDNEDEDEAATPTASTSLSFRPQQTVQVDMDLLRKNFVNRCEQKRMRQRGSDTGGSNIIDDDDYGTRLRIVTPTHAAADNANMRRTADSQQQQQEGTEDKEAVEQRLSMMLNKADFARMRLIGQFNNAFIIVRLRSDMFIIDQHAADEKYNFERLLAHTVIKSQRLIRPQLLRLGSVNVALIRDNLHVFHANGFDFQFNDGEPAEQDDVLCCEEEAQRNSIGPDDIDQNVEPIILDNAYATDNDEEDKLGTVLLTAVPVLHGWQLNRDDIDQLLSLLTELPGVIHRPSKVRKIFASKACRHSVMFGKALAQREMETIIFNMGSMDQPWNCPHGRPTIRHLCTVEKK